jgi:hypothetical protein
MTLENVEIEVVVDDFEGRSQTFNILEFNYVPPVKTIIRGDPMDDQIGAPGGFDDVVCQWKDTGTLFSDADWRQYEGTVDAALFDYMAKRGRR